MNSSERFSSCLNSTSGLHYYEVIDFLACRHKVCQATRLSAHVERVNAQWLVMKTATVTIYTRPGCHLCEEAKAAINQSGCDGEFSIEEINIDEDSALSERYGFDIPVIFINGVKVFKHKVDRSQFRRKLRRLAG
jgi:glutaredoxin